MSAIGTALVAELNPEDLRVLAERLPVPHTRLFEPVDVQPAAHRLHDRLIGDELREAG